MRVYSLFNSIDGEVNRYGQGTLTTFIRVAGCNLRCKHCFGIREGSRIPKITTLRGPNKKLNEVVPGDVLITYDTKGELAETTVVETTNREVDQWLKMKINGRVYFVTEEHPFFTSKGMMLAKELQEGDMILHSSPEEKFSFSKIGSKNPMKRKEVAQKSASNTDYVLMGKEVSKTIQKKKESGTYVPVWDLLSKEKKEEIRKKLSISKLGSNNPNWKGGSRTPNYDYLSDLCREGALNTCFDCMEETKVIPHHIDGNQENDSLSNISIICNSCHNVTHHRGYNFWKGDRKDGKNLTIESQLRMLKLNGFEVQNIKSIDRKQFPPSIRPKPLKVYNLSCTPHNTYLIDNMWVHNCDTTYALEKKPQMHNDVLLFQLEEIGCQKVTITGGEPLMQGGYFLETVRMLKRYGYTITVETNGSYKLIGNEYVDGWVVDYKLPSSAVDHRMMELILFRELRETDFVKFLIADYNDYIRAHRVLNDMESIGVKAQFAFSPVFGLLPAPTLLRWMKESYLFHVKLNTQIHKFLALEEDS